MGRRVVPRSEWCNGARLIWLPKDYMGHVWLATRSQGSSSFRLVMGETLLTATEARCSISIGSLTCLPTTSSTATNPTTLHHAHARAYSLTVEEQMEQREREREQRHERGPTMSLDSYYSLLRLQQPSTACSPSSHPPLPTPTPIRMVSDDDHHRRQVRRHSSSLKGANRCCQYVE